MARDGPIRHKSSWPANPTVRHQYPATSLFGDFSNVAPGRRALHLTPSLDERKVPAATGRMHRSRATAVRIDDIELDGERVEFKAHLAWRSVRPDSRGGSGSVRFRY